MNTKVHPCDDFYEYACGGWIKKTQIPPDRPSWTRAFDEVNLRNQTLLRTMFTDYSKGKLDKDIPYTKQIGEVFGSCMNEKYAEANARKDFQGRRSNRFCD